MRKRNKVAKLGRKKSHREAMKLNQLKSLFTNGYVTTTSVKAKVLRSEALKFINSLKKNENELLVNRKLNSLFNSREVSDRVKKYVGDAKAAVSIVKVGFRPGDNAEKSKVELKGFKIESKAEKKETKKATKKVETKVEKKEVAPVKGKERRDLGKAIKDTFVGRKERAKSRSGL